MMQQSTHIGEGGTQGHSTRLVVHRTAHGADASLLAIQLSVVHTQTHHRRLGNEFIYAAILRHQVQGLTLADAEIDIDLRVVGHRDQRL